MDTKLKSIKYSPFTKATVFLMVIIFFSIAATLLINLVMYTYTVEPVLRQDYFKSDELFREIRRVQDNLILYIVDFKSEENVKTGGTIDKSYFESRKKALYFEKHNHFWHENDNEMIRRIYGDEIATKYEYRGPDVLYEHDKDAFEEEKADDITAIHEELIYDQMGHYQSVMNYIKKKEGLDYYVTDGKNVFSNVEAPTKDYFSGLNVYYLFDNEGLEVYPDEINSFNKTNFSGTVVTTIGMHYHDYLVKNSDKYSIYFGFTDEYLNKKVALWEEKRTVQKILIIWILLLSVICILSFIFLISVTGLHSGVKGIQLKLFDRLYFELTAALIIITIIIWCGILGNLYRHTYGINDPLLNMETYLNTDNILSFIATMAASAIVLCLSLSVVRNVKSKRFIKNTIVSEFFSLIRGVINGSPLVIKVALLVFIAIVLTGIAAVIYPPLIFLFAGLAVWFAFKKVKHYESIATGAKIVRDGNLDHKIRIEDQKGELAGLAGDINAISEGMKASIEKEIKAERMKVELITNVSHDLKTPLTSIISYADLLSKEEGLPEHVNDYIKVLSQKSDRLKTLIQDLFDMSKAASGNINPHIVRIDLGKLIRQTLADLDEQIKESGLGFKVKIPDEPVFIMSDGTKLYRVFQNIIANALQYSLPGSRVYVQIELEDGTAVAIIKNTANYEITFTKEEILERFMRGEQSRTTEGSGLGLSIAKTFTEICGGNFDIILDGDLFKVEIKFKTKS